jgi:hypothetical protein
LRDTHLRFEREDLALRDLEAPACADCQEEADGSEKNKDDASQRQKHPKPIHRSIPAQSNGSIVARQ